MEQQKKPMKFRRVGRTGLYVSEVCLGLMTADRNQFGIPCATEAETHQLIDTFVEHGGNFVDTADVYGLGNSERVLGNWLAKTGRREDMVVTTKARMRLSMSDPNRAGGSRKHLTRALEESLANLQTSYVDIYMLHAFDPDTKLEETLRTMNDFVRAGKVRYVAVSNFCGWQLQKATDLCAHMGLEAVVACQGEYNLLERGVELEVAEVCVRESIALLPWSPLCGGWLTGRYRASTTSAALAGTRVGASEASGWAPTAWSPHANDHTWRLLDCMDNLAAKHKQTVPRVALRWLLQRPAVTSVVVGARTQAQLLDNLGAPHFTLPQEDMQRLSELSDVKKPYPYSFAASFVSEKGGAPLQFEVEDVITKRL